MPPALDPRYWQQNHSYFMPDDLDPDDTREWFEFDTLEFDEETSRLRFIVKKYVKEPKITRYVTRNYVRTPIYGGYKERSKVVSKFNKVINVDKFLNVDILNLNLEHDLLLDIIDVIGVTPHWRTQEIRIAKLDTEIVELSNRRRFLINEEKPYDFKKDDYVDQQGKFVKRLILAVFTFGLSFIGYVTKSKARANAALNDKNREFNLEHRIEIDQQNEEIENEIDLHNKEIELKIIQLKAKIAEIRSEKYDLIPEEEGWMMIKEASLYNFSDLKGLKGVYIIKNLDKNIYYVGQSKDMGRRLSQHFKNGEVANIKFSRDWYHGDTFGFKYMTLETKDLLDSEEKRLIELYDSFANGYNGTGGNI